MEIPKQILKKKYWNEFSLFSSNNSCKNLWKVVGRFTWTKICSKRWTGIWGAIKKLVCRMMYRRKFRRNKIPLRNTREISCRNSERIAVGNSIGISRRISGGDSRCIPGGVLRGIIGIITDALPRRIYEGIPKEPLGPLGFAPEFCARIPPRTIVEVSFWLLRHEFTWIIFNISHNYFV